MQRNFLFRFPGISWIALIDLKTRILIQPGIAIGTSQVSGIRELKKIQKKNLKFFLIQKEKIKKNFKKNFLIFFLNFWGDKLS